MFAGDLDALFNPILTLGLGGLVAAAFVLSVAFSIGYIVYLQSSRDRSEH